MYDLYILAAHTFLVIIAFGKFHGVITAATPTGSLMKIICFVFDGLGTVSPFILLASSENHSRNPDPYAISPLDSANDFPCSAVKILARSSWY